MFVLRHSGRLATERAVAFPVGALAVCSRIGTGASAGTMEHTVDPSAATARAGPRGSAGRRRPRAAGAHAVERRAPAQRPAPGSAALSGRGDARGALRPAEGLHGGDCRLRPRRQLRPELRPGGAAGGAAAAQRPRQLLCRRRQPRPGADHHSQGRLCPALRVAGPRRRPGGDARPARGGTGRDGGGRRRSPVRLGSGRRPSPPSSSSPPSSGRGSGGTGWLRRTRRAGRRWSCCPSRSSARTTATASSPRG